MLNPNTIFAPPNTTVISQATDSKGMFSTTDYAISYYLTDRFEIWCKEHNLPLPAIEIDEDYLPLFVFDSAETLLLFKLSWDSDGFLIWLTNYQRKAQQKAQ